MKHAYKWGKPFSEILAKNTIDPCLERVKKGKASMLLIDGVMGGGKTTLSVEIADYINEAPIKISVDSPFLAMGGKDFQKKILVCAEQKLAVCVYDEAGDFDKAGAITRFNRELGQIFQQFRGFRVLIIMCLPTFHRLGSVIFDGGVARALIHVTRDEKYNYAEFSVFDCNKMGWLRYYLEKYPKHAQEQYKRVVPNFDGAFLDLTPERSALLDRVSTASKKKAVKKRVMAEEAREEGLLNYTDLAAHLGKSVVWVRKKVLGLKIKETKILDTKKYFHPGILKRLEE